MYAFRLLSICPKIALVISCRINFTSLVLIPSTTLGVIDRTLCTLYLSTADRATSIPHDFLGILRDIFRTASSVAIISVLTNLNTGLRIWIEDKEECLTIEEHNNLVCCDLVASTISLSYHVIYPGAHTILPSSTNASWTQTVNRGITLPRSFPDLCIYTYPPRQPGTTSIRTVLASNIFRTGPISRSLPG